jgi:hypothetical protein
MAYRIRPALGAKGRSGRAIAGIGSSVTITLDTLATLIGQDPSHPVVQGLIRKGRLSGSSDPEGDGEVRRYYLSDSEGGYELVHMQRRIVTAFLYVRPGVGFSPFSGTLPGGLSSESTRADVRRTLGEPSRSGEETTIPGLGRKGAWDRYDYPGICFHIQYTGDGELVS